MTNAYELYGILNRTLVRGVDSKNNEISDLHKYSSEKPYDILNTEYDDGGY